MKQLDVKDFPVYVALGNCIKAGLMHQSFAGGNIATEKLKQFKNFWNKNNNQLDVL